MVKNHKFIEITEDQGYFYLSHYIWISILQKYCSCIVQCHFYKVCTNNNALYSVMLLADLLVLV